MKSALWRGEITGHIYTHCDTSLTNEEKRRVAALVNAASVGIVIVVTNATLNEEQQTCMLPKVKS